MTSLYVINPTNKENLQATVEKLKNLKITPNAKGEKRVILKQMVDYKQLKFPLIEKFDNLEEYPGVTKETDSALKRILYENNNLDAKVSSGFLVIEYPDKFRNNEAIGVDTFLDLESLYDYLKICSAKEPDGTNFDNWRLNLIRNTKPIQNDIHYKILSTGTSNCVFSIQYSYFELEKDFAIKYLENIIEKGLKSVYNLEDEDKTIYRMSLEIKTSKLFIVNNDPINIKIDPLNPKIDKKNTRQRFLYVFETIKDWIFSFKDKWIDIEYHESEKSFVYTLKKRIGWKIVKEQNSGTKFFSKHLNFSRNSIWYLFSRPDMNNDEKIENFEKFLEFFQISSSEMEVILSGSMISIDYSQLKFELNGNKKNLLELKSFI